MLHFQEKAKHLARINKEQILCLWVANNRSTIWKKVERIALSVEILINKSRVGNMRLTIEQRLQTLERDTIVLHDTVKLLHKLLKEQGGLISEYIVRKIASADADDKHHAKNSRPEEELYTFVCQRRFEKIEKDIKKTLKLIENLRFGLKAG